MMNALCELCRHPVFAEHRTWFKNGCFWERRYYQKTLITQPKNIALCKKPSPKLQYPATRRRFGYAARLV
jgi:hypothetical protein